MKTSHISLLLGKYSLLLTTSFFSQTVLSEVTLDGSMGIAGALAGPDYQITENLGQRAGNNLFHSFGQFNLNSAESATFSGSTGIKNVISRVTGGQTSTIDGAFRSTIPGANVYFLNPSGVVFGENASLDVQGSFHASTADYLKFKDGIKFETGLANATPLLTVASPEAFGFLDNAPAPISVSGGLNKVLNVPEGETLSLVAGDITINDRSLYAPSGQVVLASAGSAGEVVFNESGIDTSSFSQGGNIHLSRLAENPVATINDTMQIADIDVSADAAGKVVIRGGQMVMDNAYIWADTTNQDSGGIDIGLAGDLTINGVAEIAGVEKTPQSGITAYTQGKGNAGNIILNIDDLKLTHGTRVDSTATSQSSGNGGDLLINANSILLEGNDSNAVPRLITGANGSGDAGNIAITATDQLKVNHNAFIRSYTTAKGNTGAITINTNSLEVHDDAGININIIKTAEGNGGDLTLFANAINLSKNADISSNTSGKGASSNIKINTRSLEVHDKAQISNITNKVATGNSGDLTINATNSINIYNTGGIESITNGKGDAGDLTINTGSLKINDSFIQSSTSGHGDGGNLTIDATSLDIQNGFIVTPTNSTGNGGNLNIKTGSLDIFGGTIGHLSDENATGKSGNITIEANSILLTGESQNTSSQISGSVRGNNDAGDLSVISERLEINNWATIDMSSAGSGTTGNLLVDAKEIVITNNTGAVNGITSRLTLNATGNTGDLIIKSQNLVMHNGAIISASNFGSGTGGNLLIDAHNIEMKGTAVSFFPNAQLEHATIGSSITNESYSTGKVGDLIITSNNIHMQDNASISSSAASLANAGNIQIKTGYLTMQKESLINAATLGIGDGGDLRVEVDQMDISNSLITTLTLGAGDGNAGKITLSANKIELKEGSSINTATNGSGIGGDLTINVNNLLLNDSVLATTSTFVDFNSTNEPDTARSGNLTITSNGSIQLENISGIATMTDKANAGSVNINGTGNLQLHDDSRILALVDDGKGRGGDITITNPTVALDNSFINARAVEGAGGNITISGFLFQSPLSFVSASSKLSADGTLNLKPDTNISGNIAILPESLLNASAHLSDHCNASNENSFVIKSRGAIPLSPGELSPTNFIDFLPSEKNLRYPNVKNPEINLKNNNQLSFNSISCN